MKNLFFFFSLLYLFSSCGIIAPNTKKAFSNNKKLAPYDAIIVPGVPFHGDTLDRVMQLRVLWANYLYQQGYTKNIIYSGGAVYTPYSEARVMAQTGKAMGIPKEHIFVEERAEHSTENVYYGYRIAKENGFKKVALASDPYQTKSLYLFLKKFDLPIKILPVVFDTLRTISPIFPEINYDASLVDTTDFVALPNREKSGERFKGTLGQKIVWHEEDLTKEKWIRRFHKKGRLIKENETYVQLKGNLFRFK